MHIVIVSGHAEISLDDLGCYDRLAIAGYYCFQCGTDLFSLQDETVKYNHKQVYSVDEHIRFMHWDICAASPNESCIDEKLFPELCIRIGYSVCGIYICLFLILHASSCVRG